MTIEIEKRQELVNDVAGEVVYQIYLERQYEAEWRKPYVQIVNLFPEELAELKRAIDEVTK